MKINLNGLSYNHVYKKHSYCGGCNLLTPCGLHLARCEIDGFHRIYAVDQIIYLNIVTLLYLRYERKYNL